MAKKRQPRKPSRPRRPVWVWPNGITQSALNTFLSCPEQFALTYVEGITPKTLNMSIEFGTLFHMMCEYKNSDTPPRVADSCRRGYLLSREKKAVGNQRDELQQMAGLCEITWLAWEAYWKKSNLAKLLQSEQSESQFCVPYCIPNGSGTVESQQSINLRGKRDGVYRDTKGRLCLHEIKTKSDIDIDMIGNQLRADFQTLFYLLSLQIEYNEQPVEVLYDVVRRSQLRFRQQDSLSTYLQRVEEDIQSRPEWYFIRWRVYIEPRAIYAFRSRTLDPALFRFWQWHKSCGDSPLENRHNSPYHLLNLSALANGQYGLNHLHRVILDQQLAGYYYRQDVFPELSESILPVSKPGKKSYAC